MGARNGIGLGRLVILALLAVTLAFGGGLRPAPVAANPAIAAFLAAGGSLSDICSDAGMDDAGMDQSASGRHCAFCTAAAASLRPEPGGFSLPVEARILAETVHPAEIRVAPRGRDPAVSPRGPPPLT